MKFTRVTDKEILFQNCFYRDDVLIDPIITQNYRIIQAADSHYLSDFAISEHRQVCDVEITYIQYNEMKISIGSDAAVCKRGDTHLVFKGETHGLIGVGSCRFQTLAFDILEGSPMRALLDDLTRAYGDPNARSVSLAGIEEQVREALIEFGEENDEYSTAMLDSAITAMLIRLLRADRGSVSAVIDDAERLLPTMTSYIDRHATSISSLEEVANHLGYSYNHLYKVFRAHYRRSPKKYLTERKMLYAKEELARGATVAELATALGYSTPYNFSRAYKEYFGASPRNSRYQKTDHR